MTKKITQYSGINALMGGVFEGLFPVSEIKKHGDFGLGCSDGLTGEVIIDCCHFLEAKGNKPIRYMNDEEMMPFAQITTFVPDNKCFLSHVTKSTLYTEIAKHTELDNVFLAVKLEGFFERLKIRRPSEHNQRFENALEVAEHQIVEDLKNVDGNLIGFWTPEFFQNISVGGFHLHFINTPKTSGGHVIDFEMEKAILSYEIKYSLDVKLSNKKVYLERDLKIEGMDNIIKKVEN